MKKRFVLIAVLLIASIILYSQRTTIAARLTTQGMAANLQTNQIDDLEDGLHVALCGAGGPLPDPKRSGPCVVVVAGEALFVVDAGMGVSNIAAMGYRVGTLEALLLTHFHSDHIDGLGGVGLNRWVQNANTKQLPLIGPDGVEQVANGYNLAFAQDKAYRHEHHGDTVAPLSGSGFAPQSFTLPAEGELETVYDKNGILIEAFAVDHEPVHPAVGYRFSYGGRSAVISGDAAKTANIQTMAEGVDLLVHEALSRELVSAMNAGAKKAGNKIIEKITFDIPDYHASPVEAAETARDAGVGHLLYYHVVPPLLAPGAESLWLQGVSDVFAEHTLGQDGVTISLPANSDEIIHYKGGL